MSSSPTSSTPQRAATTRPHRILLSFHYTRGKRIADIVAKCFPNFPTRVFGDSGGFSADTQGVPVSVEEYADWLTENAPHLEVYANLDVIRDPEASAKNLAFLEARGFNPIPVFHAGSDYRHLEALIDAGYPYIALGGCVGFAAARLMPHLVRCHRIARDKGKGTVFHGFGLTNIPAITSLPWYSVDSSSWGMGYRFGTLSLWDDRLGRFLQCTLFDKVGVMRCRKLIERYGGDIEHFLTREKYHHSKAAAVSALSWRAMEEWCRRHHGEIRLPTRPDGPNLYLSLGRDYDDVSPISGVLLGGGEHTVAVSVDVNPIG